MIKKFVLIIFLTYIMFAVTSCKQSNKAVNQIPKDNQVNQTKAEYKASNLTSLKEYDVLKASYLNEDIKINYPQIYSSLDINKRNIINDILKKEALKILNYYPDSTKLSLDIDYVISIKESDLLSIQYQGTGFIKGTAHPNNIFYTTLIDINSGSKVKLKDLININPSFIENCKEGKLKSMKTLHNGLLDEFSNNDLIQLFNNADSLDNIGTENQSDTFSYLTEDSLGISLPVSHAAGDHAEFEIKYQDIKNYINTKNDIWKGLIK